MRLVRMAKGGGQLIAGRCRDSRDEIRVGLGGRHLQLGLADNISEFFLDFDNSLVGLMAELYRPGHYILRHLTGAGLQHYDGLTGAGHNQVQLALFHLGEGGVYHQLGINIADMDSADRPVEWHLRDGKRRRGTDSGQDVGVVFVVYGEGGNNNLNVAAPVLGQQRPDGTIRQAGGKGGRFSGPALPAQKAARNLAGGVVSLLVVDGQRQEVNALPLPSDGGGDQDKSIAIADGHGAAGLAGQLTGLDDQVSAAYACFK